MRTGLALLVALLLAPLPSAAREGGKKVTIVRDEHGVPHVHAGDVRSLFYGVGYAQGQDRLWQAETLRRAATGTLAEWFGPGSLDSDVQVRALFGPPSRRAALLAGASAETRTIFQAFADGMNAWIAEAGATGKLPLEYAAFHVAPRPWTTDDSVAVFMLLGSQFGWFGSDELDNALELGGLTARLGPDAAARAFADVHFLEDPSAPTTDPAVSRGPGRGGPSAQALPDGAEEAGREHRARREAAEKARAQLGIHRGPASNAVLIGPRLSKDGRPLLLGGPQMGYGAPQINHEMGIHGAGFDVTGIQIAGWPLVVIGVGKGYAWSLTSGGTDNSDIFAEALDPSNPGRYRYQGGWKDLDCRPEQIAVAGQAPVTRTFCTSVHGPIVAVSGGTAYALANTTFGKELSSYEAWLSIGRGVRDIDQFERALSGIAYNFNVMYADASGNIAHWHVGRFPVRAAGANPFLPQPGDGSSDWQGTIPFADQPHSRNPRQGWLASWNNKPGPGWQNSSAGFWAWGPVQRVNTLRRLLGQVAPRSATPDTLAAINRQAGLTTQTPSGAAHAVFVSSLLGRMLDAVDASADPRLPAALGLLSSWDWLQDDADGDGRYDSPAVAVFNGWWARAVEALFIPVQGNGLDRGVYGQLMMRLFQGADAALPLRSDYLAGRDLSAVLTASLVSTLDGLAAEYASTDMKDWLQARAEIFWKPGGIGSVPNTLWMNRGTYNQIVHLGHGDDLRAWNVVSPGQSGDFRSPHFADQLPLYAGWTYKPMRLTREEQQRHAESVTRLRVP